MQSNGGAISARVAGAEAVRTVLSGPAAGVIGARVYYIVTDKSQPFNDRDMYVFVLDAGGRSCRQLERRAIAEPRARDAFACIFRLRISVRGFLLCNSSLRCYQFFIIRLGFNYEAGGAGGSVSGGSVRLTPSTTRLAMSISPSV